MPKFYFKKLSFLFSFLTFLLTVAVVNAQEDFALRINTGGTELDYNGETFSTDTYFNTGRTLDRPQTGLPEPYQTFRYSRSQQMSYDIPIPDGEYIVNLYFAELWFGATGGGAGGVGNRIFDVTIEGQLAEDNLDIFAEVGADAMLVKTHTVTVTGGVLDIDFDSRDAVGGERHPVINAIEILGQVSEPEQRPFVTTWKTDNPGVSEDNQITIPTKSSEEYNYSVDWGDGTSSTEVLGNITHTYDSPGTYQVSITGEFPMIFFNGNGSEISDTPGDAHKIIQINSWGDIMWRSFSGSFNSCKNLDVIATDIPNLDQVKLFFAAFASCINLVGNESFNDWNMSNAEDISYMFFRAAKFNQNIGDWNLRNVVEMNDMFHDAHAFNQDIRAWRFPKATSLNSMFERATNFNGNISNWDVSKIIDIGDLFHHAYAFNQDISGWDVANVQYMSNTFDEARAFNQNIGRWNVSNVRSFYNTFSGAISFDQNLEDWNIQNVTNMHRMFNRVKLSKYNYDAILNGWSALPNLNREVNFDAGISEYCEGEIARQNLITSLGWEINDGGKHCNSGLFIERVMLIDALNDKSIYTLRDDMQISAGALPSSLLNFEVITSESVESIKMELSDQLGVTSYENFPPYTLFGKNGSDYLGNMLEKGNYTLTITPYSEDDLSGTEGSPLVINFKILDGVPRALILTFKTDNPGASDDRTISFRTVPGESAYYDVKRKGSISGGISAGYKSFTFQQSGTYTIEITGDFPGIYFENNGDAEKLISVDQWGDIDWESMEGAFSGCKNMNVLARDTPDLSNTYSASRMFAYCNSLVGNNSFENWETKTLTDISSMFFEAESFNQNISQWNVSNMVDMSGVFYKASSFNQNLNSWNVIKTNNMSGMFFESGLSDENYDNLLIGWSLLARLRNGVRLDVPQNQYCEGEKARQKLVDDFGWTINDAGKAADCVDTTSFITTWAIDDPAISAGREITIPVNPDEVYNYSINWGDGSFDTGVSSDITHVYDLPGTYQVAISGLFPRIQLFGQEKLLSVDQWGTIQWASMESAFSYCPSLEVLATDIPDLSRVTSLSGMFSECFSMTGNPSFNQWDVSNITDMLSTFAHSGFNADIGDWDVSNVTNMAAMFTMSAFNQDIGNWKVGQVTNMSQMFFSAVNFNQDISNWDVSSVENMFEMFSVAEDFNQDIGSWNVSKVKYMNRMFRLAYSFNQDLSAWDINSIIGAEAMFEETPLSTSNYDSTLIGWATLENGETGIPISVVFSGGDSQYCLGEEARQKLIDDFGWTITDGGKVEDCPEPSDFALRINTGGTEADYNGETFSTDTYFNTGLTLDRPQTGLPEPYQSFRYSRSQQMSYEIPLEDGEYTVNLYFAELWFGATGGGSGGAGSRVFDVTIEGQLAEDNLDIFAEVGADTMLMKSHTVSVTGGILDIDFDSRDVVGGERHPVINAIEILGQVSEPEQRPFVTTWKTDNPGVSDDNQITIPTFDGEVYDYTVNWGDGTSDSAVSGDITHTYATPGTYQVAISGEFPKIHFGGSGLETDNKKLLSVGQWGDIVWSSMQGAFLDCINLDVVAEDTPNLTNVTSLLQLFQGCSALIGNSAFDSWDVGTITDMQNLFAGAKMFDQPLANWNVTNVTDMTGMFSQAESFDQPIGGWNVSQVISMFDMFGGASSFNQPLNNWDVGNVIDMLGMFAGAISFNQDLGNWDVIKVVDMGFMFNNVSLSEENYDNTLIGWSTQQLQNGITFDGGNSQYCLGEAARQKLIDDFGWTITDGGKAADCIDTTSFITTWDMSMLNSGTSNVIVIDIDPERVYNYSVDWGDGNTNTNVTGKIVHQFATQGIYKVSISGDFPAIRLGGSTIERRKLIEVNQWGTTQWETFEQAFNGCFNLDVLATDVPDLTDVNSLDYMFGGCSSLVGNEFFNSWDVSNITSMRVTFGNASLFNQDISSWNVSNVNDMLALFAGASNFNQDISFWDVSNVTTMWQMFHGATSFNQDISEWNVGKVKSMDLMFKNASSFNQDIGGWNTSEVTSMHDMFSGATSFNQDIGDWEVGNVEVMWRMFLGAESFDQDLANWNVSNVTSMINMFYNGGLSTENFDNTLIGWSTQQLQSAVDFDAGNSQYCLGEESRQKLIDDFGWTITDGGKAADCPEPNNFAVRINTGGVGVTYNGETFVGDAYFDTGLTLDRPQTGLPEPFQTFRYSRSQQMSYDIPIPDGEYTVNLYFAELWFGATGGGAGGVGNRVFDVTIEGQLAEDNLDIFAEVGPDAMLIKKHTVSVTGGVLNIDFDSRDIVGGERHPVINAIEIIGLGTTVSDNSLSDKTPIVSPSVLSPNPAVTSTVLSFEKPVELTTIRIFDITGKLVHTYSGPKVADEGVYVLPVNHLESGVYLINSVDTTGIPHYKRMVIQK